MPLWPVAAREARSAARAPRTYAWRAAVAAVGIAVIPISLWVSASGATLGRAVFVGVAGMAFIYCLFGGILRTADAIAEEKRENTLGLLFLTDLKVGDVLSGKLLASTATLFFGLLAILPLLAIPVLLGGVSSRDLIRMSLCLINSLFFSISVGFLISTFFRQGWVAISAALATMLAYVFVLPIIASLLPPFFHATLMAFTPAYVFASIIDSNPGMNFWQTLTITHLIAWLNILFTAHFLPQFWQDRPRSVRAQIQWERLTRLRFGGANTRKRFRTRLLNRNPLFWLSGREQVSSFGLMVFMIFLCGLSLVGEWQEVIYALIALHATLLVRMASAASHSLAEDRKSGALELLLATSLSVRDVLKGRWMALGRQFFGPIIIVTMWHLFTILWMGVMSPYPKLSNILGVAFFVFGLAWIATGWFGMWMGLRARHPVAAIWGTLGVVLVAPLVAIGGVFSLLAIFQIIPEYGRPGEQNFESIACQIWAGYLIVLIVWTIHHVTSAFREAATDRFTDTQPIDWRPVWRVTWKISTAAALVIAAVWATRAYINSSGERALQKVLAAHPNFTLGRPLAPYIPDEQNLAQWDFLRPLNSARLQYKSPGVEEASEFSDMISMPWHPVGNRLTAWRDGARYVFATNAGRYWNTNCDAQLIRLHAAAKERPIIRFTGHAPSGSVGPSAGQPPEVHYASIANIPRLLAARAIKRLGEGEHPVDDILLALRFANCVTNDPLTIGVRKEMIFDVIQPVYEGILDGRWTDADLQQIQTAFAQLRNTDHFEVWRHYVVREIANAFAETPRVSQWGPGYVNIAQTPYYIGMSSHRPRLPGKIKAAQARIIEAGLGDGPPIEHVRGWGRGMYYEDNLELSMIEIENACLTRGLSDSAPARVAIDEVVIACAIERSCLAEGKLPATLDQLAPKYLHIIPNDFMTGAPLKYKVANNSRAYRLYSVGANGKDDGGLPDTFQTKGRQKQFVERDWVWIYEPSTNAVR
jgi:ABC-type transport system involved in multi-copper enzyme maturation permease subunit